MIGFGAGYVLGAKAGTERYEQLRRLYENIQASPQVQRATGRAKDAATTGYEQAKDKASEGVSKVKEVVEEKRSADGRNSGLTVAPPPGS
jgi:uncharacterized protein YjbJ (UPF0337 family)